MRAHPAGIKHRWWNCGGEQAFHICEFRKNSDRFEQLVLRRLFGLAQGGRTTPEGRPRLLQQAVTTLEFGDVVRFTSPPWALQRTLFTELAPIARLMGNKGCDPRYMDRKPSETAELEELPEEVMRRHR